MLCTINCTTKTTINQSIIICHTVKNEGCYWSYFPNNKLFEWFISLCYYISLVIDYSHDGYVWIKQSTDIAVNLNSADGHFDNSCFLKQIKSKHMEEEFEDTKGVIRIRI